MISIVHPWVPYQTHHEVFGMTRSERSSPIGTCGSELSQRASEPASQRANEPTSQHTTSPKSPPNHPYLPAHQQPDENISNYHTQDSPPKGPKTPASISLSLSLFLPLFPTFSFHSTLPPSLPSFLPSSLPHVSVPPSVLACS